HVVRHLESRVQRKTRDEFKEFVIRDHNARVREAAEFLQAVLGVLRPDRPLGPEREGTDRDREGTRLLRQLGEHGSSAGTSTSAEAAGDEHHVRAVDDGPELVRRLPSGLFADLGKGAGTEASGYPPAEEQLVWGSDDQ